MIITRSPLRISLGGGGTDLPSYYREHGGFLIAAAIDKYVYITKHRTFQKDIIVKYSKLERVQSVEQIEHPIVREALKLTRVTDPYIELASMADIPGGTGLGSSGSFTTALLKALHAYQKNIVSPAELAEQACHIEIDRLGEPIGKQDQYIAAVGGITAFTFHQDGRVEYRPCQITEETLFGLEDNLLLFFTGYSRSAILTDNTDDPCAYVFGQLDSMDKARRYIVFKTAPANGKNQNTVFGIEPGASKPFNINAGPALVIGACGEFRDVVGWSVTF